MKTELSAHTVAARDLLKRIICAIVEFDQDVDISAQEYHGMAKFAIRVHLADYPRVCGRFGSHIKAINFLWREIGDGVAINDNPDYNMRYDVSLKESVVGERTERMPESRARATGASADTIAAMDALLSATTPGRFNLEYEDDATAINIVSDDAETRASLIEPRHEDRIPLTTLECVQTLFRAIGKMRDEAFVIRVGK